MSTQEILVAQGKENMDIVNRMKKYEDPLLAAFDEELEQKESVKDSKS
jgi:hypothetical protein